jgi:SAM-dependent methyltransferase
MPTPAEFWDREVAAPTVHSWMANLAVRHYINRSIGGDEGMWPLDWFQKEFPGHFPRALSIGCGAGALERDFLRRGIVDHVDAFDASETSLAMAREAAVAEGFDQRTHYFTADFNTISLPERSYDLVCFHQSLHHVSRVERLLRQVRNSLRPGGLLYLDEFIGPSRNYWSEYRIRWYRALYEFFPRNVRYFDEFAMPIQYDDESEAIRSDEIMSRLEIGFDIAAFRGYGGNVLAMMFPDLHVERLTDDQIEMMIRSEQALLKAGDPHFHAIIVARPRTSPLSKSVGDLRYLAEPKLKRIAREIRKRMARK